MQGARLQERHPYPQLDVAREISLLCNLAEIRVAKAGVRTIEPRRIHRVNRLSAELALEPLIGRKRFAGYVLDSGVYGLAALRGAGTLSPAAAQPPASGSETRASRAVQGDCPT